MQLVLHVEKLLTLRGQHTLYRYSGPTRYDLGDILCVDLLLDHGLASGGGQLQLLLQGCDLLLGLDNLAVTYLGNLAVVALTLGLLCLDLQTLDGILVRLHLLQDVTLALPLCTQSRLLGLKLLDLTRQILDTLLVVLTAYGLALDLQLADTAVEVVDLLGHRVHLQTQVSRCLIDQVDSLVGQEPRRDVTVRQLDGGYNSLILDTYLMVVLVTLLQATQDRDGILGGRLVDHHLLETTLQSLVLLEVLLVLVQRRGTDGTQFATRQRRLQDVGSIHCAAALARTYKGVDLIYEQKDLTLRGDNLLHNALQTLLEFALILGACDQRTHIEREDNLRLQILGHIAVDNTVCDTLGDGGLTDTGLTYKDRVVLGTARQYLQHTTYLLLTADDGIQLAVARHLVEVDGVLAQCVELLRCGLRVHSRTVTEVADGLDEILLRSAAALQHIGRGAALGNKCQQQMLDRRILVVEVAGEVDGTLYHLRRIAREILLAVAARYTGYGLDGLACLFAQRSNIHTHTPQQERAQ